MRRVLLAAGVLLSASAPVAAEEAARPSAELFAGYSYARSEGRGLHGGDASLSVPITRWVALEADVGANYGREDDIHHRRLTLMGGPRFAYRTDRFVLFTHYLAGVARSSSSLKVLGVDITESVTGFAMAFGGGVDVAAWQTWAVRAQGDYVLVRAQGTTNKDPRVSVGVVFRAGIH